MKHIYTNTKELNFRAYPSDFICIITLFQTESISEKKEKYYPKPKLHKIYRTMQRKTAAWPW